MRDAMRRYLLFLYIFCFFGLSRAEAGSLRINPTKIRLAISPGEARSGVIEVENATDETLAIKAYLQDWRYTSLQDGTKEFFPAATTRFSCSDWISFSPSDFRIPAYGSQNLSYTVKVPEKAEAGHYAVLFFETLLQKPDIRDTSRVGVIVRIGALFYIEPQGTISRQAELGRLTIARGSGGRALEIGLDFKNTGNVDLTAGGTFHIMDRQGMIFARGEFNDVYTFPGNEAKLSAVWDESLLPGEYELVLTIDIGKASAEAGLERGPVLVRDVSIEIGAGNQILKIGELR